MDEQEAKLISPLRLAHVGDTVWDLLVRSRFFQMGKNVHHMHLLAIGCVNAGAQAKAAARILPLLTDTEADLLRRGRNANAHHPSPKNQNPADYAAATGLETLMGYLYITGQDDRIKMLFEIGLEDANA